MVKCPNHRTLKIKCKVSTVFFPLCLLQFILFLISARKYHLFFGIILKRLHLTCIKIKKCVCITATYFGTRSWRQTVRYRHEEYGFVTLVKIYWRKKHTTLNDLHELKKILLEVLNSHITPIAGTLQLRAMEFKEFSLELGLMGIPAHCNIRHLNRESLSHMCSQHSSYWL